MNLFRWLSILLVCSAVSLIIGALILRVENLVPLELSFGTFLVVIVILTTAHFTWNENHKWAAFGVILAVVSIVFNSTEPQHIQALTHPFSSIPFLILVIADILGFYAFPSAYLILYVLNYRKNRNFLNQE